MGRHFLAAWALSGLFLISATAEAQVVIRMCASLTYVEKSAATKHSNWMLEKLTPEQVSVFMENYNKAPPISNYIATEIAILHSPDKSRGMVMFFKSGCMQGRNMLARDLIHKYMGRPPGSEI